MIPAPEVGSNWEVVLGIWELDFAERRYTGYTGLQSAGVVLKPAVGTCAQAALVNAIETRT